MYLKAKSDHISSQHIYQDWICNEIIILPLLSKHIKNNITNQFYLSVLLVSFPFAFHQTNNSALK